jgi:hypothetical protein
MNQTASEYLTAEYGEAQATIQLELDWMESMQLTEQVICPECGDSDNWIEVADGYTGCGCSY